MSGRQRRWLLKLRDDRDEIPICTVLVMGIVAVVAAAAFIVLKFF